MGGRPYTRAREPVAQMVEHLTFNQVVLGSKSQRAHHYDIAREFELFPMDRICGNLARVSSR